MWLQNLIIIKESSKENIFIWLFCVKWITLLVFKNDTASKWILSQQLEWFNSDVLYNESNGVL